MSAIWNFPAKRLRTPEKRITKKLQKLSQNPLQNGFKRVTIWLQEERKLFCVKSFSSCYPWISGAHRSSSGCSPSQLLVRTAQAVSSLRVQKSSLPFGGGLFCAPGPQQGRTARIFGNKVLLSAVFLDKVSGFRKDSFGKFVLRNACVCAGLCYNRCKHF